MSLNTTLTLVSLGAVCIFVIIMYFKAKHGAVKVISEELDNFERILEHIKLYIAGVDKEEYAANLSESEFDRAYRRKARVREALANCVHGIEGAKVIVIDLIRDEIASEVKPEVVTNLLGLNEDIPPPPNIQFEIILYRYKKEHGKKALAEFIDKYGLDIRRNNSKFGASVEGTGSYYISTEDIQTAYSMENIELSIEEQIDIFAILIYQHYKGFGVIDTIREMDIDGINLGTSGALLPQVKQLLPVEYRVENSIWIYYNGKQIHMQFLSLKTEDELRRIVLSLIRYGNKGSLTQNVGRVVATAPDKARITALCPPAAECWAVFVRKFGFSGKTPEELMIKPYTKNGDLVIKLLQFLMQGMVTCAVSGRQGSGKTTLMTAIIRYIDPRFTIRTLEMSFEMYLRNLYPTRNILAVQETPHVPAGVLQDTLKKTDAAVSIVGEVATDDVAARMIQMGQVASLFTLFSHHAITTSDLIMALRNSLVNASGFSSMETAERQVIDVIKVDVHLDSTADGKRYIERITEIVPLPPGLPYPEYKPNDGGESMDRITTEYYNRRTDRTSFVTRDILKYNLDTNTYEAAEWFSDGLSRYMRDIYTILVGSGGELRLQQFYASMPFRPLQTLAGVCYNLNYYGDNIDNQNVSGFVRALTILKSDVNAQIEKLALQKAKFGIMEYLPLVAIIGITPLENYFISVIPGVALMYNGLMGYILRAVVIIAAITAYTVISRINSTVTVKENDTGAWTVWLLRHKHWKRLISGLLPKNDKKRHKMEFKLKKALSKMKLEHYYTKKVVFSAIAFCGSLVLLFAGCQLGRDYVKNSTAQLSLVAGVERTEQEQTAMRTMDEIFFAADGKLDTLQHKLLIQKYLPGLSDMQTLDEMKRMQDKYDTWKELYFKYPYVWIAFLLGLIGYGLPSLMIKARAFLVKTETEDDYMQLQTLVSILVYTGIDTLAVLQQMVQQSTVHKDILLYAYHSYPSAPELEMERLRTKITLSEFKWFIDKLKLTISELPMNEAFSDLITERENFMRLRHISMESTLAKKQFLCRIFAMAPVILFAVAEFMLPIGILGISEFQNALKML